MDLINIQINDICESMAVAIQNSLNTFSHDFIFNLQFNVKDSLPTSENTFANPLFLIEEKSSATRIEFEAGPLFPNSLLKCDVILKSPEDVLCYSNNNTQFLFSEILSYQLDATHISDLQHHLLSPLPPCFGTSLYQQRFNIVIFLNDIAEIDNLDKNILENLTSVLIQNNHEYKDKMVHVFIENQNSNKEQYSDRYIEDIKIVIQELARPEHRLNVIGKASIVLSDIPGVIVDSLEASVPTGVLTSTQSIFKELHNLFLSFLVHGCFDKLLVEQQLALTYIGHQLSNKCYTINSRKSLEFLLIYIFHENKAEFMEKNIEYFSRINQLERLQHNQLILQTQQTIDTHQRRALNMSAKLTTGQRKLQKFRESPKRFFSDSNNIVIRSLINRWTVN